MLPRNLIIYLVEYLPEYLNISPLAYFAIYTSSHDPPGFSYVVLSLVNGATMTRQSNIGHQNSEHSECYLMLNASKGEVMEK